MAKSAEKPVAAKGKTSWLMLGVVALASVGAGFFAPSFLPLSQPAGDGKDDHKSRDAAHAFVPFGDIVVNLRSANQTRYLKVKIVLVTEKEEERSLGDLLNKNKAFLKNSVIGYLADRTLEEVKGTAGINRIRRELLDQFNALLYKDGPEKVRDLLFEEFFTQ
jgi:flagellar FliL protein